MISSLVELTKPRITAMILVSSAIGFWFGMFDHKVSAEALLRLFETLLGISLMASGTAALNQWWERAADARMRRTAGRPIPSGRLGSRTALFFGIALAIAGLADLVLSVNWLSGLLCLGTLLAYLLVYTPLKQRSTLCTSVGAFPGAMPPVIGFAASHGQITPAALALGAILFLWQFPHFYAIAWMYRDDYARGGLRMLPVADSDGASTARHMVTAAAVLIPVSALPAWIGMTSPLYAVVALIAGFWYLMSTIGMMRADRTTGRARTVLLRSVCYLPLLYLALFICRT